MIDIDLIAATWYLALGSALGAAYFLLLLRSVSLHAAHATVVRVAPLYLVRIGAAVSAFWLISQQGALPLLLALLGFLAARTAVQLCAGP